MDVHIASDMLNFCHGSFANAQQKEAPKEANSSKETADDPKRIIAAGSSKKEVRRIVTVVCPSRELSYAIFAANNIGTETTLADLGLYGSSDGWKGVDKWIDLSTSETIWR